MVTILKYESWFETMDSGACLAAAADLGRHYSLFITPLK